MPGSDTYFLEVSAHVSLKVATKDSFRDNETIKIYIFRLFLQSKNGGVRSKKNRGFSDKSERSWLVQKHIF